MREQFFELAEGIFSALSGAEIAGLTLRAERSSFARINRAKVRQAGDVDQRIVELTLIRGARQASATRTLSGRHADDLALLSGALGELRELIGALPDDPHLLYDTDARELSREDPDALPDPHEALATLLELGAGQDLVGLWASGALHRAFASSLGHRLWQTSHSFHFDFSVYAQRDKAAKGMYAGTRFDREALRDKLERAAAQVDILRRPEKRIEPGSYRVYLTPAALARILGLFAWDAFGVKSHRTRQTALLRMLDGASLAPSVSIAEDAASGVAPPFLPAGFARPERVELVREGRLVGALVSPRSAREYGLEVNADAGEQPRSVAMAAGDVRESEILERLGTGVYVTDTWYTNYSDLSAARVTGMTRFATTWVEGGEMVAPLAVMRFDDTLYRMLGSELEGLTSDREWMLDGGTYFERSTDSMLLPGALVRSMTFTL